MKKKCTFEVEIFNYLLLYYPQQGDRALVLITLSLESEPRKTGAPYHSLNRLPLSYQLQRYSTDK